MFRKDCWFIYLPLHFLWAWILLETCGFHIFPQFTFRRSERSSEEFKQKISPGSDSGLIAPPGSGLGGALPLWCISVQGPHTRPQRNQAASLLHPALCRTLNFFEPRHSVLNISGILRSAPKNLWYWQFGGHFYLGVFVKSAYGKTLLCIWFNPLSISHRG